MEPVDPIQKTLCFSMVFLCFFNLFSNFYVFLTFMFILSFKNLLQLITIKLLCFYPCFLSDEPAQHKTVVNDGKEKDETTANFFIA